MRRNVGSKERIVRLIIGSGAAAAAILAPLRWPWRAALGSVAASGIATGISRFCPINRAIGVGRGGRSHVRRILSA
jgi:hypothetical protein